MKVNIISYNNNIQKLEIFHNIMKKKLILLIRLNLYLILKLQTFIRSFFKFDFNLRIWKSLNIKKKRLVYHVLKSPHIHKKAQEKFLFQNFNKIEICNLNYFYLNKIYKITIKNLFIFICLLSFSSNFFKLMFSVKQKIII